MKVITIENGTPDSVRVLIVPETERDRETLALFKGKPAFVTPITENSQVLGLPVTGALQVAISPTVTRPNEGE